MTTILQDSQGLGLSRLRFCSARFTVGRRANIIGFGLYMLGATYAVHLEGP